MPVLVLASAAAALVLASVEETVEEAEEVLALAAVEEAVEEAARYAVPPSGRWRTAPGR